MVKIRWWSSRSMMAASSRSFGESNARIKHQGLVLEPPPSIRSWRIWASTSQADRGRKLPVHVEIVTSRQPYNELVFSYQVRRNMPCLGTWKTDPSFRPLMACTYAEQTQVIAIYLVTGIPDPTRKSVPLLLQYLS